MQTLIVRVVSNIGGPWPSLCEPLSEHPLLIHSSARSLAFHEREVRVILDELKRMVESGQVQPVLDSTCDVTNAALVQDAFQRTAGKSTIGKAVVTFVKSH